MVRVTRDKRILAAGKHAVLIALQRRATLPDRPALREGVHLFAADGTLLRSWSERATTSEAVLAELLVASQDTPGFPARLAAFLPTWSSPALTPTALARLRARLSHRGAGVRAAAAREAIRLGAPAYRALAPLVAHEPDTETRRRIVSILAQLRPLMRLVKKRHLYRASQQSRAGSPDQVPTGARLVESRACGSLWLVHGGVKHPVASLSVLGAIRQRATIVDGHWLGRLPEGPLFR